MTDFSRMARIARDNAEIRIAEVSKQREIDKAERLGRFNEELGLLHNIVTPVLEDAKEILRGYGISVSIIKSWLEKAPGSEHPELIVFCDGPEMRNRSGSLSSPKSARAIFHYEIDGFVAEVTDYSFSTIRHPTPGKDAKDKIEAALKLTIESYYRELEHLRLEGSLKTSHTL